LIRDPDCCTKDSLPAFAMPAFFLKNNLEVLVWSLLVLGTVAVQDYRRAAIYKDVNSLSAAGEAN